MRCLKLSYNQPLHVKYHTKKRTKKKNVFFKSVCSYTYIAVYMCNGVKSYSRGTRPPTFSYMIRSFQLFIYPKYICIIHIQREYLNCKRENTRGSPHYTSFYTFLSISILRNFNICQSYQYIFYYFYF